MGRSWTAPPKSSRCGQPEPPSSGYGQPSSTPSSSSLQPSIVVDQAPEPTACGSPGGHVRPNPAYTLGALAAKLRQIVAVLQREGLYDDGQMSDTVSGSGPKDTIRRIMNNVAMCVFLNCTLQAPTEFVRVVVISPGSSAGLGDFRAEIDRLQRAGLCPAGRSATTHWRPWPISIASAT
jgi:hypothetical protein